MGTYFCIEPVRPLVQAHYTPPRWSRGLPYARQPSHRPISAPCAEGRPKMVCKATSPLAVFTQALLLLLPCTTTASLLPPRYQHYLASASTANVQEAFWTKLLHSSDVNDRGAVIPASYDEAEAALQGEALWRIKADGDGDLRALEDEGFDVWRARKPFIDLRVSLQQQADSELLQRFISNNA